MSVILHFNVNRYNFYSLGLNVLSTKTIIDCKYKGGAWSGNRNYCSFLCLVWIQIFYEIWNIFNKPQKLFFFCFISYFCDW